VVQALVDAIKALRQNYEYLFDGLERNHPQNFFDNTVNRRIVLTELIKKVDASDIWKFFSLNCFREEDCSWLFHQLDNTSLESERHVIAVIIDHFIRRYENRDAVEEVLRRAGLENLVTR